MWDTWFLIYLNKITCKLSNEKQDIKFITSDKM